ncbi:MAG TPA: hypothetical protein VGD69_28780 [Herpetosiphonaceae bacterium]
MVKLFSTRAHGVLDYLTAGTLVALPRALGWSDDVTKWMTGMALGTIAYSAVTRYELGLLKWLPVKSHLTLDALNGGLFCMAPLIFPKEDSTVKGALVGIGLFELLVTLTTETESSYAEQSSEFVDTVIDQIQHPVELLNERAAGA